MADFYTIESAFRIKLGELIKTTFPNLPIVKAEQNNTQPVDILNGESMLSVRVEQVIKYGTDYHVGLFENQQIMGGDRSIQVLLECYDAEALDKLNTLRDIWETPEYGEIMYNLGLMEQRQSISPSNSTRRQSREKYVTSARYVTKFDMGIFYTSNGVILTNIESATVTRGTVI